MSRKDIISTLVCFVLVWHFGDRWHLKSPHRERIELNLNLQFLSLKKRQCEMICTRHKRLMRSFVRTSQHWKLRREMFLNMSLWVNLLKYETESLMVLLRLTFIVSRHYPFLEQIMQSRRHTLVKSNCEKGAHLENVSIRVPGLLFAIPCFCLLVFIEFNYTKSNTWRDFRTDTFQQIAKVTPDTLVAKRRSWSTPSRGRHKD